MAGLGSLVLELAANTARLQSDMGKAVSIAERSAKAMDRAFTLLGVGSFTALTKQVLQFGDDLNKASIKAGLGGKAISELAYAAKQADVDLGSLSNGLKFMQVNLSKAASGTKESNDTLKALGLTVEKLSNLSADAQFELIAQKISELVNPADKARAAVELFGKAGADLLPLFEKGAEGIRAAREEAQRVGASLSGDAIKALADADDSVKRLTQSFTGFAAVMISKVAPALSSFLDNLTAIATGDKIGKLREQIDFIKRNLEEGGGFLAVGYGDIGTGYFTAAEGAQKLLELQTKLARLTQQSEAGRRTKPGDDSKAIGFAAQAAAEANKKAAKESYDAWVEHIQNVYKLEQGLADSFRDVAKGAADDFERMSDAATERGLNKFVTETARAAEQAKNEFSAFGEEAARNIQDAFAQFLFDPFKDGLRGMLLGFVNIIRKMIAEALAADLLNKLFGSSSSGGGLAGVLGSIFGGLFGGGKSGGGGGGKYIPGFASGGSFEVGGQGGTDSQLVAFRATPGERVRVSTPGQSQGAAGMVFAPTTNINGVGLTAEQLAPILRRNTKETIQAFMQAMDRSGLRQPVF